MLSLTTTISAVTLSPDRARVTRTGKASLEPGLQTVEIANLPAKLTPDSLRAHAYGAARARLLGVQAQRSYFAETPSEQVRALEVEVEKLQDAIQSVEARHALSVRSQAGVDELAGQAEIYATALAAREWTLEAQLELFAGLRRRAEELQAEQQALEIERRELERRLQKAKSELDRFRGIPAREQYTALVELEVLVAGELTIELSYLISGAGWQPLYDLRLESENAAGPGLEVSYLAQVVQRTGEPWQDITLTLSTARPALSGSLPEPQPWYIGPPPPPPPMPVGAPAPRMKAMRSMDSAAMSAASEPAPVEANAEPAQAVVDTSGAAVAYQVSGRVTIPGDGAPHKVTIARYPLRPKLDYVSTPRLVQAVYRRARLSNDSPYTLLPGAAALFAGDEYLGSTRLELTPPQGEIELTLGVEDRIKVERELKRREVDRRLMSGRRRIVYAYEISLHNHLPGQARVRLQENIPVSRHEEIKVRLESAEPKPLEQSELNLLAWELTLAPQEKLVVRYTFSVESPQEMQVVGLP